MHTRLYQRWYPIVCPYGAAVFGIGVVVLAVIAASQGVSLIASVVLAIIYNGRDCIVIMGKEYGDLTTGSFRKGPPAKAGAAH